MDGSPVSETARANVRKEIVCGLRALRLNTTTVRRRSNSSHLRSNLVESPPSPRALQILSRVHLKTKGHLGSNETLSSLDPMKLLDKTSQYLINKQKKTENFLWGCFPHTKDMGLDIEYPTTDLPFKLLADSQTHVKKEITSPPPGFENPTRSLVNTEVSVPPGFENIWTPPPFITLNIHGTSNTSSDLNGSAGLVRDQSGKWVFGYGRCHQKLSQVAATFLALYHGLKILWDSGHRRIRLETSVEIIDCLTTKSNLFRKRKSILGSCKDMILREWECEIYQISKEENSCAEWLANRIEKYPQGFVFFEDPPRGLVLFLEKDQLAAV